MKVKLILSTMSKLVRKVLSRRSYSNTAIHDCKYYQYFDLSRILFSSGQLFLEFCDTIYHFPKLCMREENGKQSHINLFFQLSSFQIIR